MWGELSMAMQIMFARTYGRNIEYIDESYCINVTQNLDTLCKDFFKEESFFEDGEEIIIQVMRFEKVKELSEKIEENIKTLLEKVKKTKGERAKDEIVAAIWDYILLRSLIISMLVSSRAPNVVLTIS